MGDINVTPLVDIVLVLLIIFMVVTPMLSSGVDVQLPNAKTTVTAQDNGQHLVISIREDGVVFVEADQVDLENLVDRVNEAYREDPNRAILIKGDSNLFYGEVRAVMDTLSENGMSTMLLAAEKLKE
ncbi:MAG: biopolymer transporter ExbD [Alphaproteobacteria bacterium]|nr:biopolymer transporter ExbD [Alphaproteobacteria bacterium]MCB9792929.1 biopolymer transporter ExbD [Alphaproteobacteria bacterium]